MLFAPLTMLVSHLPNVLRALREDHVEVYDEGDGASQAVMVLPEDYQSMQETIEVLSDPATVSMIDRSLDTNETVSFEEMLAAVGAPAEPPQDPFGLQRQIRNASLVTAFHSHLIYENDDDVVERLGRWARANAPDMPPTRAAPPEIETWVEIINQLAEDKRWDLVSSCRTVLNWMGTRRQAHESSSLEVDRAYRQFQFQGRTEAEVLRNIAEFGTTGPLPAEDPRHLLIPEQPRDRTGASSHDE